MPTPDTQNDAKRYVDALLRKKWWVIVPTLLIGLSVTVYAVLLPDEFRSTTLILVTPQKVPTEFVPSTVTTEIQDRLSTIGQQIMSRTALEQVIQEFGLFVKEKKNLSAEEVVLLMRERIRLKVNKDQDARRRGADSFEVSFTDGDPKLAMMVTAKLAGLFIEENLKVREQQAIGTSQFLGDEIERYKAEVQQKEQEIFEFKRKYMNETTDQLASNQARLAELQNRLQINTQTMNGAKDRRVLLQQQLSDIEKRVHEERDRIARARREAGDPVGDEAGEVSPVARELAKQREELARLRLAYTDRHPEVTRLLTSIQRLEAEQAKGAQASPIAPASSKGRSAPAEPGPRIDYPPVYFQIRADVAKAEAESGRLAKENEALQRQLDLYQGRIAAAPARELQMKQLSEGYKNVKAVLDSLTDKKLQADLSENMEKKQKGEQFRILDPANLPEKPVAPDRLRIAAMGFLAGAGLGAALVLLPELLLPVVRRREELRDFTGLPVLGAIPFIVTAEDLARRRRLRLRLSAATVVLFLLGAGVVHFAVAPLPRATVDFYSKVKKTHWTTMSGRRG